MQLYENAYPSNYEELKTYYPVWYRDVLEMDAIWQAMGHQLDGIQSGIVRAVDNCFIETADESTIKETEDYLEITYFGSLTLEERRALIKSNIIGSGKMSSTKIKEIVRTFTNAECEVSLNTGEINIEITFTENPGNPSDYVDTLRSTLEKKLPAHLKLTLQYALTPNGAATAYVGVAAAGMFMSITAEVKNYGVG